MPAHDSSQPPTTQSKDHYAMLELPPTATPEQIRTAFKKLSRRWHPDKSQDAGSNDHYRDIIEAYQVLSDPATRQVYDFERHRDLLFFGGCGMAACFRADGTGFWFSAIWMCSI